MVYVIRIRGTNLCKIGVSKNVEVRIGQLRTASPYELEVITQEDGGETKEKEWHRKYWQYRIYTGGQEWFDLPPEIIQEIGENNGEKYQDSSTLGGIAPFDVRQVRGRQQHHIADKREIVPGRESWPDNASRKLIQPPLR